MRLESGLWSLSSLCSGLCRNHNRKYQTVAFQDKYGSPTTGKNCSKEEGRRSGARPHHYAGCAEEPPLYERRCKGNVWYMLK